MAAVSFEVGAAFIVEDRATEPLAEIGRAFERLDELAVGLQEKLTNLGDAAFTGLKASVDRAYSEVDRLITQAAELGRAWADAGRIGSMGGGGGRSGGGRGGAGGLYGPPDRPYWGEHDDYANARAENANLDQVYQRQQRLAELENANRNRMANDRANGLYGPPARPYWGEGDDYANALAENRAHDFRMRGKEPRVGEQADQMFGLADAVMLYKAYHSAGEEQKSLYQGVKAFNLDPATPEGHEAEGILRAAAREAAEGTSYKEFQTAAGIPALARPFTLEGVEGVKQFAKIYPGAARAAEAIEMLDPKSTFSESLPAMVEFAHQNRRYDPSQLQHQYDLIGIIAGMVPKTTYAAEVGAQSYVVPLARAAGMNPEHAAMLVGSLQQAGLRGTIASTTLRQEMVGLTRSGGPMQSHLGHDAHALKGEVGQFEKEIRLSGEEGRKIVEDMKGDKHILAMKEVGLLDAAGRQTYLYTAADAAADPSGMTKKGGINVDRANEIFARWSVGKDPEKILEEGYRLFGIRGEQAPIILGGMIEAGGVDYTKNFEKQVRDRMIGPIDPKTGKPDPNYSYLAASQSQMATGFLQQMAQAGGRWTDGISHMADSTIPILDGILSKAIVPAGNFFAAFTAPDAQGRYDAPQKILGGVAMGGLAGGALGALLGFIFGGGPAGIIPGAMAGASWGARAGAGAGIVETLTEEIKKLNQPRPRAIGPGSQIVPAPSALNNVVNNLTLNVHGLISDETKATIASWFSDMLKTATATITSDPRGSSSSIYTQPAFQGF